MKLDLNYRTVYFFVMSLSAIILVLTLTNTITQLNFKATIVATILIIILGIITWIYDLFLQHKADEEEASQYWNVWFYPPFKELKDKQRKGLTWFIVSVVVILLLSWAFS